MINGQHILRGLLALALLSLLATGVYAEETLKKRPVEVGDQFAEVSQRPEDGQIINYAVRKDGWVAVMVQFSLNSYRDVNVYDDKSEFQTSYHMWSTKALYTDWNEQGNLIIVNDSGDVRYELAANGKIMSVERLDSNIDTSEYVKQVEATQKVVGNRIYVSRLRNKLLRPICSFHNEIVCIEEGKETVVYYTHTPEGLKFLLIVIGIPVFFFFCIRHTIRNVKRSEEEKKAAAPPE